jgi:hypothetical protein
VGAIAAYLVLAVRRVHEPRLPAALGRAAALGVLDYLALTAAQLAAPAVVLALP